MNTGDVILIHNSTPAQIREILGQFNFKIGAHPFKDCTATGAHPTLLLRGVPEDYLPDVKSALDKRGITSRFILLKEVEIVSDDAPELGSLIKDLRAKELED